MILFEDQSGLCCYPSQRIASITPAFPQRLRIVTSDGIVGYCYAAEDRNVPKSCRCSAGLSIDPTRVRRIEPEDEILWLSLEDGQKLKVTTRYRPEVLAALGVDSYVRQARGLTRVFLREYPFELARASAEQLREHFSHPRVLIANLIWQTLEFRRQGVAKGTGTNHRGFWYNPVLATLERAGFGGEENLQVYQTQIAQMVDQDALFDYRDLGFVDTHAHQREIGNRHPEVILVIEKESTAQTGIAAARELGLSWIVTGGVARLVSVEFFCAALREVYQGPVKVIDFGDFDPGGWVSGRAFVQHLERHQTPCPEGPQFLTRPELFSQEELELFSRPLSIKNERIDGWLEESGGIGGKARGIHCDWLQPPERVHQALQNLLERLLARDRPD